VPLDQRSEASESGLVDLGTIALSEGTTFLVHVAAGDREAQGAVARADLGNRWSESDMLTAQVWNGEALISGVSPGRVTVSVLAGRRLLCEQSVVVREGGSQEVDCRSHGLRVSGYVQVGGVPAGTGTLSWSAPDLAMPSRIDTVVSPAGLKQFQIVGAGRPGVSVAIAADGSFETEDLSPGRWRVVLLSQGSASGEQIVDIPAEEYFETVLSFPGLAVTGTVVDREGKPVERARVRELTSGGIAFSDPEGNFSLVGLKAGKSVVQAQLQDQTSPLAELNLRIGERPEPLRLVLGQRKAPSLTVRIVDAGGAPVPGAFVFLDEEGKGQRLLVADAQGQTEVRLEPPLPPRVRAAAFSSGSWGFGDWLDRQAADGEFQVEVAGAESFVVTSDTHQGSPRILTPNGWDVSWLLRLLGAPPRLAPDLPLRMSGLVAGRYSISLDGASVTVTVREQHPAEGRLE
ncbi:MAG TPA: carboxypeptidase-like regulatory domain-containing protein, partial [Thermoanaerobaculia bacterium]|nr:carboxypeptidase-like regulatory domain-containing protein [Thermoanaerobaculia bacterium]